MARTALVTGASGGIGSATARDLGRDHDVADMLENGEGRIVNVFSTAGTNGSPTNAAYGASKSGLLGLTKSLAQQYTEEVTDVVRTFATTSTHTDPMEILLWSTKPNYTVGQNG
jgi:NAD(P)-dependent dehydrogenase (short-subunit alcohol dehydrogenase family)